MAPRSTQRREQLEGRRGDSNREKRELVGEVVEVIENLSDFKFFTASPRVVIENDTTDNTTHSTVIQNIRSLTGIR